MKYIIGGLIILAIIGSFFYVDQTQEIRNQREIQRFVDSKGATKIPKIWKEKVGEGI